MHLDPYLARVHDQLVAVAALGDDRTKEVAQALTIAATPAVRLALLGALSGIADEVTAALLDQPGAPTVSVRIDGDEVAVDVRGGPSGEDAEAPQPRYGDGEANARISLRLPDSLKTDIDSAAERDGISVNTWLVRAAGEALRLAASPSGKGRARRDNSHHVSGWING